MTATTMSLKETRIYNGYTLRDVAAALRIPVAEYWIYAKEPGEMPVDDLVMLAALYGCSVDDLVMVNADDASEATNKRMQST